MNTYRIILIGGGIYIYIYKLQYPRTSARAYANACRRLPIARTDVNGKQRGIDSCFWPLCCSSWLNFAANVQRTDDYKSGWREKFKPSDRTTIRVPIAVISLRRRLWYRRTFKTQIIHWSHSWLHISGFNWPHTLLQSKWMPEFTIPPKTLRTLSCPRSWFSP